MRGRGESAGGTTYHSTTVRRVFFQLPSCGYWARFVSVRTCLVGDAAWFRFSVAVDLPQTEAVARVGIFLFVTPGTSLGLPPSQCGYRLVSGQRISAGSGCRQWSGKNMQASIVPRSLSVSQYTERLSRLVARRLCRGGRGTHAVSEASCSRRRAGQKPSPVQVVPLSA